MKIKPMFDDCEEINIESYLEKCGVEDITGYLSGQIVEPYSNYENIEECAKEIIKWVQ